MQQTVQFIKRKCLIGKRFGLIVVVNRLLVDSEHEKKALPRGTSVIL